MRMFDAPSIPAPSDIIPRGPKRWRSAPETGPATKSARANGAIASIASHCPYPIGYWKTTGMSMSGTACANPTATPTASAAARPRASS